MMREMSCCFFFSPSRLRNVEREFGESEDVRKKQMLEIYEIESMLC